MDETPPESPPSHGPNGKFLPGNKVGAMGRAATRSPWQPVGVRLQKWLNTPGHEIRALLNNLNELSRLSSIDIGCVRIVAGMMFNKKDDLKYFNSVIDRVEGFPIQTTREVEKLKPTLADVDAASNEEAQAEYERLTKG
jgi:hypothetical protein